MLFKKKLISEIESILDQLIKNAEVMQDINDLSLLEEEICALQKTQNSLLARLLHLHQNRENAFSTSSSLEGKIKQLSQLNAFFLKKVKSKFCQRNPSHKKKLLRSPYSLRRKKTSP